jgi:hypothetical protein
MGGSGFIVCFVDRLPLSGLGAPHKEELLSGAEHMGEAPALLTWVVFGGIVVAPHDRPRHLASAALRRAKPDRGPDVAGLYVPDRHADARTNTSDKLFIGWFGPRGLATIVFAVLVLDVKLPGNDTIMLAAGWTVLLRVIAHGVTANPLVRRMATRPLAEAEDWIGTADENPDPPVSRRKPKLSGSCTFG